MTHAKNTQTWKMINIHVDTKTKLEELVAHYSTGRSKMNLTKLVDILINEEYDKVITK